MEITVDASEIEGFAAAMAGAPGVLESSLTDASGTLLAEGVAMAQENAPVDEGTLHNSIEIIEGPSASGGSYGTNLIYAAQREYGGTIRARNAPFLVFEWNGALVFTKEVHQTGTQYMGRSMDSLEPKVLPTYEKAVDRVMESL